MSEYQVDTNRRNRDKLIAELHPLGIVTDVWPDGSFNFEPYDEQCEADLETECVKVGVTSKLL